ncbi:MAG: hypothetical protein MUE65_02720 [Methanomassiliicoccales archaeon]|jgi:hypothetical protein|nr:hypothetical protein [Methanomassiliicoccales archaeon]
MLERPKRCVFKATQVGRFLKRDRDERGVASTVGTIMALLVFLTFLSLFTNSYIPVWMVDNERSHMNNVMNQFGEMKSKVDMLSLGASISGDTDLNMYQPVDLGADGIPVFAAATAGVLNYNPFTGGNSSLRVRFSYVQGASTISYDQLGGGMVMFYAPNRYYVQQWVTYENGAIMIRQDDGQTIRAFPSFELDKPLVTSKVNVSFTQVDFIGRNSSVAGTSNAGLNIDLLYFDEQLYEVTVTGITLDFKTLNGRAWFNYLDTYIKGITTMVNNTDYVLTHSSSYDTVTLRLLNVTYFTFNRAITQISLQMS